MSVVVLPNTLGAGIRQAGGAFAEAIGQRSEKTHAKERRARIANALKSADFSNQQGIKEFYDNIVADILEEPNAGNILGSIMKSLKPDYFESTARQYDEERKTPTAQQTFDEVVGPAQQEPSGFVPKFASPELLPQQFQNPPLFANPQFLAQQAEMQGIDPRMMGINPEASPLMDMIQPKQMPQQQPQQESIAKPPIQSLLDRFTDEDLIRLSMSPDTSVSSRAKHLLHLKNEQRDQEYKQSKLASQEEIARLKMEQQDRLARERLAQERELQGERLQTSRELQKERLGQAAAEAEKGREMKFSERDFNYAQSLNKPIYESMADEREYLANAEQAFHEMEYAYSKNTIGAWGQDKWAQTLGEYGEGFFTPEGAVAMTAAKKMLTSSLGSVKGPGNMFLEKVMLDSLPKIGRSEESNRLLIEFMRGDLAKQRAKLALKEQLIADDVKNFGYAQSNLGQRISEGSKQIDKDMNEETAYRIQKLREDTHGLRKMSKKKVVPGTPLTKEMGAYLVNKYGREGAEKEAKRLGYNVLSGDTYNRLKGKM